MADDKYYRITKDEALFNAYNAYANTNNPDDRAKIESLYDSFKKGKISTSEFNVAIMQAAKEAAQKAAEREHPGMVDKLADVFVNRPISNISSTAQNIANAVMQAAKAQGKTDVAKQGGTPTTDGAHTEKVAANPGNGIDAQGKSEIPNSSAVSDANAAKTQANAYNPSIRLNNNVQYVMNTLKTYGYPQQVLDSFKQNIDKILANTKDNNRIDTANQYIDQFLGDKSLALQDLRRLDPVPGKPAPNQQPQSGAPAPAPAPADVTDAVMKAVKADGNTSFANWRQSLVNQNWDGDPSKIKYDPSTGKFMSDGGGQAFKGTGKPALDQQPQKAGKNNKPGKKPRMSDAEIDAFLEEELGNGTYASPEVAKGGTYASPGISSGGTYATGEGIKDANGNVLTNPGGNADYQYALRDPSYGLYARDRLTDAQKEYLQAVAHDMGYNYDR